MAPSIPTIKQVRDYYGDKTAGLSDYDLANKLYGFLKQKETYKELLDGVDKPSFYALTGVNADMGEFSKGVGAGVDNLQSTIGAAGTMIGRATGIDSLTNWGEELRTRNLDEASQYIPAVSKVEDIDSISAAGKWLANQAGQQIPNMGSSLIGAAAGGAAGTMIAGPGGGIVGGAVGAFAPNLVLNAGDVYSGLVDKGVDPNTATKYAAGAGVGMGALDTVLPGRIAGRIIGPKATSMMTRAIMGQGESLARKIGVDAALEAGTETAQQLIQNTTESLLGVGPTPEEARSSLINSAAAGGAMGILGGGISHVLEPSRTPNMDKVNEILAKQKAEEARQRREAEEARLGVTIEEINDHAARREREITEKLNGTPDQFIPKLDNKGRPLPGKGVLVRGKPAEFVTPEEKAELEFLRKNKGNPEALAQGYGRNLGGEKQKKSSAYDAMLEAEMDDRPLPVSPSKDRNLIAEAARQSQEAALDRTLADDMDGSRPFATTVKAQNPPLYGTPEGDILTEAQANDPETRQFAEAARAKTAQLQAEDAALFDHARKTTSALPAGTAMNFKQFRNALGVQDAPTARKAIAALEAEGLASKLPDGRWSFTGAPGTPDEKPAAETPATLKHQQAALVEGRRPVQMFPTGTAEMELPQGMERVETPRGVFHFNPKAIDAATISAKSAEGRENEILGLGPMTKAEIIASGEPQVAVVERAPDGTEVLAALSTEANAEAQRAEMAKRAAQGHTVTIEPADKVVKDRQMAAAVARTNINPTDAQKEAGNYAKAPIVFQGIKVKVETPKGVRRRGKDSKGKKWSVAMPGHYGYVTGTKGADGDSIDVTIGDNPDAPMAYVINQHNANNGHFDEHKGFLGYNSQAEAEAAYDASFSDKKGPKRRRSIVEMTVAEFDKWTKTGDTSKPIPVPKKPERPQSLVEFMSEVGIDPKSAGINDLAHLDLLKDWHRSVQGAGKSKTFDPERKKFRKRIFREGGVSVAEFITRAEQHGFPLRIAQVTENDGQAYTTQSVDLLNKLVEAEMGRGEKVVRDEDRTAQDVYTEETTVDDTADEAEQSALVKARNYLERQAEEYGIPNYAGMSDLELAAEVKAMQELEADVDAFELKGSEHLSPELAQEYDVPHDGETEIPGFTEPSGKAPEGGGGQAPAAVDEKAVEPDRGEDGEDSGTPESAQDEVAGNTGGWKVTDTANGERRYTAPNGDEVEVGKNADGSAWWSINSANHGATDRAFEKQFGKDVSTFADDYVAGLTTPPAKPDAAEEPKKTAPKKSEPAAAPKADDPATQLAKSITEAAAAITKAVEGLNGKKDAAPETPTAPKDETPTAPKDEAPKTEEKKAPRIDARTTSLLRLAGHTDDAIEAMTPAERKAEIDKMKAAAKAVTFNERRPSKKEVEGDGALYISTGAKGAKYTLRIVKRMPNGRLLDEHVRTLSTDKDDSVQVSQMYADNQGRESIYWGAPEELNAFEANGLTGNDTSLVDRSGGEAVPGEGNRTGQPAPIDPVSTPAPDAQPRAMSEMSDLEVIQSKGLSLEAKVARSGKTYWALTGNTVEHKDLLDRLGFASPYKMGGKWSRSKFDADPTAQLAAALRGGSLEPTNLELEPAPELDAEKAAIVLAKAKLSVANVGGKWLVTGKGTFDNKQTLRRLGGKWNGDAKAWSFDADPSGRIAYEVQAASAGTDGKDDAGDQRDADEELRLKQLRQREDGRPDERATGGDASSRVSDETKRLIRLGEKAGIPEIVMREQVEDIGMAVAAYERQKPVFIIANEAGTGKTFVLGGVIRELRARGQEKFVYVTMNQDLVDQIKRDLKAYGLDGVEFTTYSALSGKSAPDATGAVLIFDEAHNVKNDIGSARGAKGQGLMADARLTVVASATPFENPVEARYVKATGLFDASGGFDDWAKMYGAAVRKRKFYNPNTGRQETEEIIYWPGRGKKEDGAAARNWFFKQGVMTQRAMRIPADMTETQFLRTKIDQQYVDMYDHVLAAYDAAARAYTDENGNPLDAGIYKDIAMHRENATKRILESAKVDFAIARAKEHLAAGKNVVIFVETKADRTLGLWRKTAHFKDDTLYTYPQIVEMMEEWKRQSAMARMMDEKAPPRPFADFIVAIAQHFHEAGVRYDLPSTADKIKESLDEFGVGIYTGGVSAGAATKAKAAFLGGKLKVLIATMAKGGTGLSLHDTVGTRPTVQVNLNLPWKGTGVAQVSGRVARYGLQSKARIEWLFAQNIPWEAERLAPRVGARMRDMGAIVGGIELPSAEILDGDFDFEGERNAGQGAGGPKKIEAGDVEDDIFALAERLEASRSKADDTSGGFFETPFPLAALITKVAAAPANSKLLEPSAGTGNLLRFLDADKNGIATTAVEIRPANQEKLKDKVGTLLSGDFLDLLTEAAPAGLAVGEHFDTIVMNPPFERKAGVGPQDVAHVMAAYSLLAPKGRLVAIMGEGPFFREEKKSQEFRQWLDDVGATVVDIPAGAFKNSGTGVKTRLVVVDKGGEAGRSDIKLGDTSIDSLKDIAEMIPPRISIIERGEAMAEQEATPVEAAPQEEGAEFDPARHIILVADDVASVRGSDVERLFEEAPRTAEAFDDLRVYLVNARPDLAAKVMDAIEAVGMPERPKVEADKDYTADLVAKGEAIRDHLRKGGMVVLRTQTKATEYSSPADIAIGKNGPRFRQGNDFVAVTADQINDMVAQIESAPAKQSPVTGYSDQHPQWAKDVGKSLGGQVVYSDGEVALVEGFSVLSGKVNYAGALKDGRYTRVDIESFTGDTLSAEQKARLVQAKKDAVAQDRAKYDARPNGPFVGGARTAFSDGFPRELAEVAQQWLKMLGVSERVYFTTTDDARDQAAAERNGLFGPYAAVRSAGLDANEKGSARTLANGDHYIAMKLGARQSQNLEVLAHEIGHILEKTAYKNADAATRNAITGAYQAWLEKAKNTRAADWANELRAHTSAKLTGKAPAGNADDLPGYWTSFNEFFADQVSRWATSSEKPLSVVDKFFKRIADGLRRLYAAVAGKKFLPTPEMKAYLDGLAGGSAPLQGAIDPPPAAPSARTGTIKDFGEKVGGARKDKARTTISREESADDDDDDTPGWRRRFEVRKVEGARQGTLVRGRMVTEDQPTHWVIYDKRKKEEIRGEGSTYWKAKSFATPEEAEAAIPLIAVAQKHRVTSDGKGADGNYSYVIYRRVSDRKTVIIKDGFTSHDEAMLYMAKHAAEIIETKTNYGEEILSMLEAKPERTGPKVRTQSATEDMYKNTFGFRAVEFGNWNNQEDRQELMDFAYDALVDMASLLGIPPRALSLEGELAIAFGSRGKGGKNAARAHYEGDYGIINLTKMKGAGTLAHEWAHAVDHYFARKGGVAPATRVANSEGHMVFPAGDYISERADSDKTKLREDLKASIAKVINTIRHKAKAFVVDVGRADAMVGREREDVARRLTEMRAHLAKAREYGAKKKPATEDQLARWDALAGSLIDGRDVNVEWKVVMSPGRRSFGTGQYNNDTIQGLSDIYKEVTGRAGRSKDGGPIDDLAQSVRRYGMRLEEAKAARDNPNRVGNVATDYVSAARTMDKGAARDYWSTTRELFARAFSAYVEDKLESAGRGNDFLSFGSDNKFFEMYRLLGLDMRPFPEGDERTAINEAFDAMFSTLKTRETSSGVEMYSVTPAFAAKREAAAGVVKRIVDDITGGRAKVSVEDVLYGEGEGLVASGAKGTARQEIAGSFTDGGPLESLIAVSLAAKFDAIANAAHEGYHFAKRYLIQADEDAVIQKNRPMLARMVREEGLDPETMSAEEIEAVAFGRWYALRRDGKLAGGVVPAILRGWNRIKNLLDRLASYLKGNGFKTLDSVFADLADGKMAKRGVSDTNAVTGEHFATAESPAFRKWFGKSVVVDRNGKPRRVYHGTASVFDRFSKDVKAQHIELPGFFFTPDADIGSAFADSAGEAWKDADGYIAGSEGANVLPVYLSLQNPKEITLSDRANRAMTNYKVVEAALRQAMADGHDGAIIRGWQDGSGPIQYVVFSNSQIKSVFNRGTWDSNDPNINYSVSRLKDEAAPLFEGSGGTAKDAERARLAAAREAQAKADFNAKKRDPKMKAKAPQEEPEGGLFDALPKKQLTMFSVTPAGTEAQQGVLKRIIATPESERPWRERVRDAIREMKEGAARRVRQAVFDQFDAIKQLELDTHGKLRDASVSAYKATRMTRNINSVMAVVLRHGPLKWEDGAPVPVAGFEGGFEGIFKDAAQRGELDLLKGWMVAKRARRLKAEGRENLLSDADIDTLLNVPEDMRARFQAASDQWQKFNGHILEFARESGVLNQEQIDLWSEHADYVPFYRLLDDDGESKAVAPGTRGGISNQRSGIKALTGGEQQINDPIENMVMSMARLVDSAMKNEAMSRVVDLAVDGEVMTRDRSPMNEVTEDAIRTRVADVGLDYDALSQTEKDKWGRMIRSMTQPGGSQVSVMIDGKPVYYTVHDAQLLRSLSSFSPKQLGAIMSVFRGARQLLTRAVTLDPAFMARNFVRDTMSAWVTAGEKNFRPGYDSVRGFKRALAEDGALVSIMAAGGPGGGYYDTDPKSVRKQVESRFRQIEGKGARVLNTAQKVFEAWERIGSASEMANRIAIYDAVKKRGGTNAEAAFQALDLMDFGMRGDSVAMRVLIETVPFMNARLQGLYKLWRGATEGDRAGKLAGINRYFLLHGLVLMAATMALAGANQGEDWYEDLEDWAKDGFYWFKVGDQVYSLPKPFEVGSIFSTIPERFMRAMTGRDTTKESAKAAVRMFSDTFAMNPTPQIVKPMVDVWANKDSFTGREIVPARLKDLMPEAQYTADTSDVAKIVGDIAKVSPLQIESLLRGYFGTLGSYVLDGADMMARGAMGLPAPADNGIYDIPAVGGVIRSFVPDMERRGTLSVTKFYDLHRETEAIYRTFNEYQKRGDFDAARALLDKERGTLAFRQGLNTAYRYMSDLTEQMRAVQNSTTMNPAAKREALVKITAQRNLLAKKVMSRVPATASLIDQVGRVPSAKAAVIAAAE